jgi:hypothetical protein
MEVIAHAGDDQDGENDRANQEEELLPSVLSPDAVSPRHGLLFVLGRVIRLTLIGVQQ